MQNSNHGPVNKPFYDSVSSLVSQDGDDKSNITELLSHSISIRIT